MGAVVKIQTPHLLSAPFLTCQVSRVSQGQACSSGLQERPHQVADLQPTSGRSHSSTRPAGAQASDSQAKGYLVSPGWGWVGDLTRNPIFFPFIGDNRSPQSCVSQSGGMGHRTSKINLTQSSFQMSETNFQAFFKQVNVISFFLTNLSKAKFERAPILLG